MIHSSTRKALMVGGLLLGCLNGAQGAVTVLDFEGTSDFVLIEEFYNGGGGGDFGVSFLGGMLGLKSNTDGGSGGFAAGSSGTTGLFVDNSLGSQAAVMNVADGFTTGFSFYYVGGILPGPLRVYSGLDGTGDVLEVITLPGYTDTWTALGVSFSGVAYSVSFADVSGVAVFDDVTLGSATPGVSAVPEPSSYAALAGVAVAGFAMLRRRRA